MAGVPGGGPVQFFVFVILKNSNSARSELVPMIFCLHSQGRLKRTSTSRSLGYFNTVFFPGQSLVSQHDLFNGRSDRLLTVLWFI